MCPLAKLAFWKQVCHRRLHPHTKRRLDYWGKQRGGVKEEREKDKEVVVANGSAVLWVVNLLARVKFHSLHL